MNIRCNDGDLAMIIRDEPGLEVNVGRLLWVYGPLAQHPELGAVWETCPATNEPMAYLDQDGQVCFDRREAMIVHPDAWMTPVHSHSLAGQRPPRTVTPVALTKEWLESVAAGPEQVYLELPGRRDPATRWLTGSELRVRLRRELCIPIEEDYGYESWFWFPGRSLSATVHWWVKEGVPQLIGEVCGPADQAAYEIHTELEDDGKLPWVFADGDWNTFMVLPARFKANLIPRFARTTGDVHECRAVKYRMRNGKPRYTRIMDDEQLLANWRLSEALAEASEPDGFLENLRRALRRKSHPAPVRHGQPGEFNGH